jgi:hypothetical protein
LEEIAAELKGFTSLTSNSFAKEEHRLKVDADRELDRVDWELDRVDWEFDR